MEKVIKSVRRLDFSSVRLYAVTGDTTDVGLVRSKALALIHNGIDALQLRAKSLTDRQLIEVGLVLKEECEKFDVLFLVNDRPDIALVTKADGVHLGHQNMPIAMAREILGHRAIIGASAHSLPQAIEAQRAGADYVSCGPIWATPTKPQYEAVGLKLISLYKAAVHVPFVAIGGIDLNNIGQVIQAGATSVAVVRGLFDAPDPAQAVKNFKKHFE